MEARKIARDIADMDDGLVVVPPKQGQPLYNIPAMDRYCKANGLDMSRMTEKDWEPYIIGYSK